MKLELEKQYPIKTHVNTELLNTCKFSCGSSYNVLTCSSGHLVRSAWIPRMKRFINRELPWGEVSKNLEPEHTSVQHSSDRSELHSGNTNFKSCFLVIQPIDLMKHGFRLFTRQNDDAVISAFFWSIYHSQITETFFDLGSYRCSLWLFYSWSNSKCGMRCTVHGRTERHPDVESATEN